MSLENVSVVPLKDVVKRVKVGFVGSCNKDYCSSDEGVPMIRTTNLTKEGIKLENLKYINNRFHISHKKSQLHFGDILIARHGHNGLASLWEYKFDAQCLNVVVVEPDESLANRYYLTYLINSPIIQKQIKSLTGGSVQSVVNTKDIADLLIPVPSLDKQKEIADFISLFNKKINVNKSINKNLAKLIDLNFKNSLLNFDTYSEEELTSSEFGPIPKGWEVNNLTGIANYQNGLAMQKFPPENPKDCFKVLKIKELRQGFFDENSDSCSKNIKEECVVYDGDVIFSWSGSLLVDIWTGGTCGLNQHLFKVTSSQFDKWFYYCWTKFYLDQFILIAKDKATTMGHIKRQHLDESLVLIPNKETYDKLTNLFQPLFELLIKNKIEIKKLQQLRDTLLPKLMSGEIDVSKINCDLYFLLYLYLIDCDKFN